MSVETGTARSPWMTTLEAADHCRCLSRDTGEPSRNAFRKWATRHRLVPVRRGSVLLYTKADIERAIRRAK